MPTTILSFATALFGETPVPTENPSLQESLHQETASKAGGSGDYSPQLSLPVRSLFSDKAIKLTL